ncbi:hypothetical protein TWF694_005185 [Orbilia ellipsospora]|uniref:Uncharacterized protein n=1 Tax=Orbilia ellipsospora TaxID=2528407 RepID=A0AAV9WUU4_9PEZI
MSHITIISQSQRAIAIILALICPQIYSLPADVIPTSFTSTVRKLIEFPTFSKISTVPETFSVFSISQSSGYFLSISDVANQSPDYTPWSEYNDPPESNDKLPQLVHADMMRYPVVLPPRILDVSCNARQFCMPLPSNEPVENTKNKQIGSSTTIWHHAIDFNSMLPTESPTIQQRNNRELQYTQYQYPAFRPTITIYTTKPAFVQAIYPPNQYQYPPLYTQPPYSTPTPPLVPPEMVDPYHPGIAAGGLPKACRIPKTYEGICHPMVIPTIVLVTYLITTILYYGGANHCLCLSSRPPCPPSAPLGPGRGPVVTPQGTYVYHHPLGTTPQNDNIRVGHYHRHWMGLTSQFHGNHLVANNAAADAKSRSDRINQTACYFLTTMLSYGAGLVILGAFLGGLCNCVKSECEFK